MNKKQLSLKNLILLLLLLLHVHDTMGFVAQLLWSAIKVGTLRYACNVVPGLTSVMLARNIANMALDMTSSVKLPEATVEILKNAHDVSRIIEQPSMAMTMPTIPVTQHALEQCKIQQCAISQCTQQAIPKAVAFRGLPGVPGIAYVPKTIGPETYAKMRTDFIAGAGPMPKASDHITITATVDGAIVFSKPGTSPVSLVMDIKTSSSVPFDHYNEVLRKTEQAIVHQLLDTVSAEHVQAYPVISTIKPSLQKVEHTLIEIIKNPTTTLAQVVDTITDLQLVGNNCVKQMEQVETLYRYGHLEESVARGLYSLCEETYRTVSTMRGVFCDGSGNITCLDLLTQQRRLGSIFGSHCERIGYDSETIAKKLSQITNARVLADATHASMYEYTLASTEFNQDLICAVNNMRAGCPEVAHVIMEKYNPANHGFFSNTWHNLLHNREGHYCILQKAHQEALATLYNSEGMLKIYEQHPLWQEMQNALQKYPTLKQQILNKLRHEHAFCLQEFKRIGIVTPTDSQMQQMYTLVQYADVHNFGSYVQNIRTSADVSKALESCIQARATETYLRELGFSDSTVTHIIGQCTDLQTVMCDPHFKTIVQDVGTGAHGLTERLQLLAERRDAISALINRLGIDKPNALTKTICYQLLDSYHDASGMLDILQGLDPLHADPLMRQTYADFFDAHGLQKVLPVSDQVRALVQERVGTTIDITSDPVLRDACNRLAVIQVSSPEELCIIERGLNYIKLGQTQGNFMREYASRFAGALTNPSSQNAPVLAAADAVDVFSRPDAGALGTAGLERLAKLLNSSASLTQDNVQMLTDLKSVAELIKNSDVSKAQRIFDRLPPLSESVATSAQGHHRLYTPVAIESASAGYAPYTAPLESVAGVSTCVYESPLARFATATSATHQLLQDGKLLLTTTDGVLIAINGDTIAHIAFDGSVDMLRNSHGVVEHFAQNMQGFAQWAEQGAVTRRFILEHAELQGFDIGCYNPGNYGAPVASSSTDHGVVDAGKIVREGDIAPLYAQAVRARIEREQVASDMLTRVRERSEGIKRLTEALPSIRRSLSEPILRRVAADIDTHAATLSDYDWMDFAKNKGFAKHVSKAAVYAVATGGAPSPDDPRSRWNRFERQKEIDDAVKHPYGKYVDASYHNKHRGNTLKSKAPIDGQKALDTSLPISKTSTRRISVCDGEIVVLSFTRIGEYHGHVREFHELEKDMQRVLEKAGLINSRGKIK